MTDLVSIIMPNYNCAKYIPETIKSVLAQTYFNWELLFIDDCSTDNSVDIVKGFNDDRIKIYINEKNSGAAISRNLAVREAKGKYIAFLDSADLWTPEKLEKQIAFMKENGYAFTYSKYEEINEQSKKIGKIISGPKIINKRKQYNYCWQGCLTVVYDMTAVGLIQIEDIKKNNDYAMWLKVVKKTNCYLYNEILRPFLLLN